MWKLKGVVANLQSRGWLHGSVVAFDAVHFAEHDVLERIRTRRTVILRSPFASVRTAVFAQRCRQHQPEFFAYFFILFFVCLGTEYQDYANVDKKILRNL